MRVKMLSGGIAVLALAGSAGAAVDYDSLGFEVLSSGFGYVGLEGQAGGSPVRIWQATGGTTDSATALIAGDVGVGGSDAIAFELADNGDPPATEPFGDYGEFGIILPDSGIGEVPTGPVAVSVDLNVLPTLDGPLFGLAIFGSPSTGTGTRPIATDFLVDSGSGTLYMADPDSALDYQPVGAVALNEYHTYELVLDYQTKSYSFSIDGALLGTFDFRSQSYGDVDANGKVNDVLGLTIFGIESGAEPDTTVGIAYYDNLVVVPEPGMLALAGVVGLGLLGRRRRRGAALGQ